MKRALFDINVVLDVLLDREPHVRASAAAWRTIETGRASGFLAANAVTTIEYFLRREMGAARAQKALAELLRVFAVAAVDDGVIREALDLHFRDFEDAVAATAARRAECDFIVTRDPRGFLGSRVRALAPEAAAPILEA